MINGKKKIQIKKEKNDRKLMKKGDNRRNARYRERSKIAVEIILNNRFRMSRREKKKKPKIYTRKKEARKFVEKERTSRLET